MAIRTPKFHSQSAGFFGKIFPDFFVYTSASIWQEKQTKNCELKIVKWQKFIEFEELVWDD